VTVASGAKLGGTGTIGGQTTINSGGTLLAHNLTFTRGLNLSPTAAGNKTVQFSGSDLVIVADHSVLDPSVLTWGSATSAVTIDLVGKGWEFGSAGAGYFTLLFDLSDAGAFSTTSYGGPENKLNFTLFGLDADAATALAAAKMSSADLWLYYEDGSQGTRGIYLMGAKGFAIPEPSTWLLLGAGAAFTVIFRRRKA